MPVTLKQPREDVASGTDREDDLLSLEGSAVMHREALIGVARLLYRTTLVGNPAPVVEDIDRRLSDPQPGDLVVETSVMYSRDPDKRLRGLGILLEKRTEWYETDEEYAELVAEGSMDADEPRFTDTAWYIQFGPKAEDVCRWTNCAFIALPYEWEPPP
ncbi:hypothetical protein ACWEJ6_21100 [Nonomuraea sp. NPDC004702]